MDDQVRNSNDGEKSPKDQVRNSNDGEKSSNGGVLSSNDGEKSSNDRVLSSVLDRNRQQERLPGCPGCIGASWMERADNSSIFSFICRRHKSLPGGLARHTGAGNKPAGKKSGNKNRHEQEGAWHSRHGALNGFGEHEISPSFRLSLDLYSQSFLQISRHQLQEFPTNTKQQFHYIKDRFAPLLKCGSNMAQGTILACLSRDRSFVFFRLRT